MAILFLLKESLRGYKSSKLPFFLTIFTCFISLSLLGIFSYLFLNASLLADDIKSRIEIELFLSDTLNAEESLNVKKIINKYPFIENTEYLSKDKAKERFIKETGIDFQSVITSNPLPASIIITLKNEYRDFSRITEILNILKNIEGVSEVVFNQELLMNIQEKASLFQRILLGIFILVTLATIYIISNIIRLNIFSRLDDINTMRLVGAKPYFIKLPFIFEGIIVGFLGGLLAVGSLIGLEFLIEYFFKIKSLMRTEHFIIVGFFLILCGIVFGYLGSLFSISKFFKKSVF